MDRAILETLEGKFQQKRLSQAAILTHEHVVLLGFQRVHPKCQSTSPPPPLSGGDTSFMLSGTVGP